MDVPGAAQDPAIWQKAQEESARLLEELKKAVKAEHKDVGVLRKELRVTVPAQVISDHMEHNFSELMHDAFVPGFRKGRAPRQLVEKRYGSEVRESLTTAIIGQSYFASIENEKLDVLGDPRFQITTDAGVQLMEFDEALQHFKLPESGDFTYTCEIELKPQFTLPELHGIPVVEPEITVTDEMVAQHMLQRRKIRGRFEPVAEAAEKGDQVVADVTLRHGEQELKREENASLGVRPTAIDGIPLPDLEQVLVGARAGDTRTCECTLPPDHERTDLRGAKAQFTFRIHEIKRLVPEGLPEFLQAWGFESEAEARDYFREQLEAERSDLLARARHTQIEEYLLANTALELPEGLSARQTERAVLRRAIELQQRGVPLSDIEAQIDQLRTSAQAEVQRELKLSFILDKIAADREVEVTDEELNTAIARMAQLYNRRFDRVRDDLQNRGQLKQLVEQLRQNKTVELLLADAKVGAAAPDRKEADGGKGKQSG